MHSHYHRAQIATRLRELSGQPPLTNFNIWIWDGKLSSQRMFVCESCEAGVAPVTAPVKAGYVWLFVPQGGHWIDRRRSAGGHGCGNKRTQ